jgi:hypothetical protein
MSVVETTRGLEDEDEEEEEEDDDDDATIVEEDVVVLGLEVEISLLCCGFFFTR